MRAEYGKLMALEVEPCDEEAEKEVYSPRSHLSRQPPLARPHPLLLLFPRGVVARAYAPQHLLCRLLASRARSPHEALHGRRESSARGLAPRAHVAHACDALQGASRRFSVYSNLLCH